MQMRIFQIFQYPDNTCEEQADLRKGVRKLAKTIITQDGDIVNYGNLVIIFARPAEEIPYGKYEIVGIDSNENQVIIGRYKDQKTAEENVSRITQWLSMESYATYEMPGETGEG